MELTEHGGASEIVDGELVPEIGLHRVYRSFNGLEDRGVHVGVVLPCETPLVAVRQYGSHTENIYSTDTIRRAASVEVPSSAVLICICVGDWYEFFTARRIVRRLRSATAVVVVVRPACGCGRVGP